MPKEKPANYLILAIITTFFCCQITGVVSIVYAARVNAKWDGGDYAGAEADSKNAKLWGLIGLIGGGILVLSVIVVYGALITAAIANGDFIN
jgi:hypothetical protein